MTKQINTFQEQIKTYTGTLELGSTTPSYDLETEIDHRFTTDHITNNIIYETINEFRGEIDQFPPVFSALKKEGKRLYEFARAGENVEIKSRKVTIHNFEVLNIKNKAVDFCVTCSKGTYIRSLAHDFGKALKSGAHLTALRRTKIGSYSVENAASIEDFILTLN
jgi:tRNA pseudouridine55 synthase